MGEEHLTVGEFTRAMAAQDKRLAEHFSAMDGRLSVISRDTRDIRNVLVSHEVKLAVLEAKPAARATTKWSWGAGATGIALAIAEGARRYFKP